MRITSLVLLTSCLTLAACSTAEQAETSATAGNTLSSTGTMSATEAGGTTGQAQTSDPLTTSQGQTSDITTLGTGTDSASTTPGTSSDTSPVTSGTGTGTDATSTTTGPDNTTGNTTGNTSGSSTDTTTGGISGGPCEVDADCKLHDDCCSCYPTPVDNDDPSCEMRCDQSKCSELGLEQAVCHFGQCTFGKVDCSSDVLCNSLPPDCEDGTLPSIENGCWTGHCVPAEACDKVPDCALCPDSMMCVEYQSWTTDKVCEPIPADCNGEPNCECAGAQACVDPFGVCNEGMGETDLACICIAC